MIEEDLKNWVPRQRPTNQPIFGQYINIAPYDHQTHPNQLWDAFGGLDANELIYHFGWPQMQSAEDLGRIINGFNQSGEFVTCIFEDKNSGKAIGMASYMRIDCENGSVETGSIAHGAALSKSRAGTEAHYLMAKHIFDELGYRRYEWKLNDPNKASHAAARRFGFTFEGVFRQHQVKPYGNRDTAWYSMLNHEWLVVKSAFEAWLDPSNFDSEGKQIQSLQEIRGNFS
ncbi:MAG: GNAT family protein [Pseudomonadota bacterium]